MNEILLNHNSLLLRFFGTPLDDLVGRLPREVWTDGRFEEIHQGIEQALKTKAEVVVEFSDFSADGKRFHHLVLIVSDKSALNRIVGIIAFGLDITERRRTESEVYLLNCALDNSFDATFLLGNDLRFRYVNEAAVRALGYSREELLSLSLLDIDPNITLEMVHDLMKQTAVTGRFPGVVESRHRRKSGETFPIEVGASTFSHEGETLFLTAVRDITERKQKEAMLYSLSRKLKAISSCNHLLLRAENEQELLNGICKLVCDEAGYLMAWVGFAENDEHKTVRPVAYSGYEEGYLDGIQITWADTEQGQVPIGIAIRTGMAAINHDFQTYPGLAPWREAVKRRGFRSSVAVPLTNNGRVLGSLNIYSGEPQAFRNREEVELLQELANDIAYGVLALRTRFEMARVEAELHTREQEFRAMIENSPDYIARYDTQCRRIYINFALQEIIGLPTAEILGTTLEDKTPILNMSEYRQRMNNVLKTGCEDRLEISWISPQGVERWGDVRLSPEFGKDGTVVSLLAITRDITDRKRMEQTVISSEIKLRSVLDSSPDTIIGYDLEGRIRFLNARLRKILQRPEAELIGKLPLEAWPDGRFVEIERAVFKVLQTQVDQAVEQINRPPNGKVRVQQIRVVPERNSEGELIGVLAFGRDITDLVQRESHLDMLEQTVNQSHEAVYVTDANFKFIYVNEEACRALQYVREELIGLSPVDIDPMVTYETAIQLRNKMQAEGMLTFESIHRRRDGSQFPVEIRGMVFEYQGELQHMTLVRDISERKQSEQSLRELHNQLRQLMAHLEQAREKERKLIAREVHDELGQILTALKLNISVIDRKYATNSPPLREHVQETMTLMKTAIASARNISAALRSSELHRGIVSALRWQATRFTSFTGVKCELHCKDEEVNLDEDYATAIFRITQEALTNVAKHANAKRVDITLDVRDDFYMLKVCDDGTGFNPNTGKENTFGLLGIRERAIILGGTLAINSGVGQGTEIITHIPVKSSSENT